MTTYPASSALPRVEPVQLTVCLRPDDMVVALRADALAGLIATPKTLSPKWLYDDRGCELFDRITNLPEYYPTRTERAILASHAGAIVEAAGADTLIELGSGTSEKTRLLLDAMAEAGTLGRFVPFDVAEPTLSAAASAIALEYPGVGIEGVVGDFERHLSELPTGGRRLLAFLGGTIGNLHPPARAAFLCELATLMGPDDTLLLGTDLVKDRQRLVAAYDDSEGVTAAFNKNVLAVLNRELGAGFDLDLFDHVALFDERQERMEMRLRSQEPQVVPIEGLGINIAFEQGEDLLTEISTKFRPEGVTQELRAAGLEAIGWWTDPAGDFALSLSRR